jgi:ribosomal protein L31E
MLKEKSFQWQEETRKTLRIFIRSALGQKMFSKEEVQIFFKILEAFWKRGNQHQIMTSQEDNWVVVWLGIAM